MLGINIDEMGQEAALIKVVARMFELKFDSLWQRYERAKRRKRLFVLTGILIFALACLGVGGRMTYLNNEIAKERDRANAEAVRANKERDSAVRANQSLQIANDSIIRQSDIISQTNADLERKKRQLEETNIRLAEERDRVIEARKISDKNYTALASKTIIELWDKGEHLNAVAFARDVYNKYPHTVDLEQAYWHCLLNADYVNVCELDMKEKIKSIYHDKCSDYTAILTDWHIYIVKINNTIEIEKSYRLPQIFSEYLDIVYNRDNDILIASCSSGFCVYNSSNNKFDIFKTERFFPGKIELDPKFNIIAFNQKNSIRFYDLKNKSILPKEISLGYKHQYVNAINYNRSGDIIAIGVENVINLYDSHNSTNQISSLVGHTANVTKVIFKNDTTLYSSSSDGTIRRWNLINGESEIVASNAEGIKDFHFNDDFSQMISCSSDKTIMIWDCKNKYFSRKIEPIVGHNGTVNCVCPIEKFNYIISGSNDKKLKLWRFKQFRNIQIDTINVELDYIAQPTLCKDGNNLVISNDNTIESYYLYNIQSGNVTQFTIKNIIEELNLGGYSCYVPRIFSSYFSDNIVA